MKRNILSVFCGMPAGYGHAAGTDRRVGHIEVRV